MPGLAVLERPPEADQHGRFRLGRRWAVLPASGARGGPAALFSGSSQDFVFGEQTPQFIPDLTSQFLQVHERACSR